KRTPIATSRRSNRNRSAGSRSFSRRLSQRQPPANAASASSSSGRRAWWRSVMTKSGGEGSGFMPPVAEGDEKPAREASRPRVRGDQHRRGQPGADDLPGAGPQRKLDPDWLFRGQDGRAQQHAEGGGTVEERPRNRGIMGVRHGRATLSLVA